MQDDSQNQGTQSNPIMDFIKQMTGWGGNQDTMPPNALQQLNMVPYAPKAPSFMNQPGMQSTMGSYGAKTGYQPTFGDKMFGYQDGNVQYGAMAPGLLQGAGSIAQSILGWGQLGEAKRQNAFTQDAWQKQYDNQATLTNASQRDRQSARVAAAPGAYQSVGEYMQQNKVG